ncbi:hypothetical protein LOK46_16440 [Methylobacterium sp. NMS14P]|uniref:hypothetical protein n=1 Tax=Methylobacterium sp. NMS14P TaxID=2894310 RepID=UPI002359B2B7|nr:hypothetical protein [Methylobacterium sp. NMS14P]WCS22783.1 hypothetical protein LOK46_16440 [Methylobacterium sp. NMS14P]
MLPGSPEHAAEVEQLARTLARGVDATSDALQHITRHMTALTFGLVFLMGELEERGGLDRAALAKRTLAGLRLALPEDPETEQAVRDLFGQGEGQAPFGPPQPGLRLIEGGKSATTSARPRRLNVLSDPT